MADPDRNSLIDYCDGLVDYLDMVTDDLNQIALDYELTEYQVEQIEDASYILGEVWHELRGLG